MGWCVRRRIASEQLAWWIVNEPAAGCRRTSAGSSTLRRWFSSKPPAICRRTSGGLQANQRRTVDEPALVRLQSATGSPASCKPPAACRRTSGGLQANQRRLVHEPALGLFKNHSTQRTRTQRVLQRKKERRRWSAGRLSPIADKRHRRFPITARARAKTTKRAEPANRGMTRQRSRVNRHAQTQPQTDHQTRKHRRERQFHPFGSVFQIQLLPTIKQKNGNNNKSRTNETFTNCPSR